MRSVAGLRDGQQRSAADRRRFRRCGNPCQTTGTVRDDGDLRADQIANAFREGIIDHEAHRDPGDRVRGAYRGDEQLVGVRPEDPKVRLARARRRPPRADPAVSRPAVGGNGGCEHAAVCVEHQHHVGTDALCIVPGRRKDGGHVAARHRLAEAEIRRQHADADRQLHGAKVDQLLGQRSSRAQLSAARASTVRRVLVSTAASVTV